MEITLIGDVHSNYVKYLEIIKTAEYSLQLGDFGYSYSVLSGVDHTRHEILAGNHDNYSLIKSGQYKHFLLDYGYYFNSIFYIRGGFSINKNSPSTRIGVDWFPEEELSSEQMEKCFEFYKKIKPQIVVSHEAPRDIANQVGSPDILRDFGFNPDTFTTRTSEFLQRCFVEHQPGRWYFGHYHKSWKHFYCMTLFRCLAPLETVIVKI